jgi:hypothetical protein
MSGKCALLHIGLINTAMMKMIYTVSAALLAASFVASAEIDCEIVPFTGRANTFTKVQHQDRRRASFEKRKEWEVIQLPTGGFIGDVLVTDQAAVGAVAHLSVREVQTDDLYEPMKHAPQIEWFGDMSLYDPDSIERKLLYEHTWQIDRVPFTIPIIIPKCQSSLARCVLEISDADGQLLYTCTPGETYQGSGSYYRSSGNDAWVFTDDEEAYRRLKAYARISKAERMTEFPGDWTRFIDVKALWVGADTELDPALMRKIDLSGGGIFGDQEGLVPHRHHIAIRPFVILRRRGSFQIFSIQLPRLRKACSA